MKKLISSIKDEANLPPVRVVFIHKVLDCESMKSLETGAVECENSSLGRFVD